MNIDNGNGARGGRGRVGRGARGGRGRVVGGRGAAAAAAAAAPAGVGGGGVREEDRQLQARRETRGLVLVDEPRANFIADLIATMTGLQADHTFRAEWVVEVSPYMNELTRTRTGKFDVSYVLGGRAHAHRSLKRKTLPEIASLLVDQHYRVVDAVQVDAVPRDLNAAAAAVAAFPTVDVDRVGFVGLQDALAEMIAYVTSPERTMSMPYDAAAIAAAVERNYELMTIRVPTVAKLAGALRGVCPHTDSTEKLQDVAAKLGGIEGDGDESERMRRSIVRVIEAIVDQSTKCMVCYDDVPGMDRFTACKHLHRLCQEHIRTYVRDRSTRVDDKTGMPLCHACNACVSVSDIRGILGPDEARDFVKRAFEDVGVRTGRMARCAVAGCVGVFSTVDSIDSVSSCGRCDAMHCVNVGCHDLYENHVGKPPGGHCADVRAAKRRRTMDDLRDSVTDVRKPCPKCLILYDKVDGTCNAMRCPVCASHYCFLCLTTIAEEGDGPGQFSQADANSLAHAHMHADQRGAYGDREPRFYARLDETATPGCVGRMFDASGPHDKRMPDA